MKTLKFYLKSHSLALWHVAAALCLMLLNCHNEAEERAWHRPRKDMVHNQLPPAPKKPLIGLFVDGAKAASGDGKSWDRAFRTIQEAINASTGQNIYVAAGSYVNPNLDLRDKNRIFLFGGYKAGEKYEKNSMDIKADEYVVLDGGGNAAPLAQIQGAAEYIAFMGGFIFQNVHGASAVVIHGNAANEPVKNIRFYRSKFLNNQNNVNGNGAGLIAQFVQGLLLDNVDADNNQASDANNAMAFGQGGFLHLVDIDGLSLLGGIWSNNKAAHGGALYLSRVTKLTFSGQRIEENQANNGGGVYIENVSNQELQNLSFKGNKGIALGTNTNKGAGLSLVECQNLRLTNSNFTDNKLDTALTYANGGAIFIENGTSITLDFAEAKIQGNRAKQGGAINIAQGNALTLGDITIRGGEFTDNQAEEGGGIYGIHVIKLSIMNAQFESHKAFRGGAIYIVQPAGNITITNTFMKNNQATLAPPTIFAGIPGSGGAVMVAQKHPHPGAANPQVIINDSQFEDNKATGNGGAFLANNTSYEIKFKNTIFLQNKTDNFGGALALDASDQNARFILDRNTKFIKNHAERGAGGGAMYVVFNHNQAILPVVPPAVPNRHVVFYNTRDDFKDNTTGPINAALSPAPPNFLLGTASNYGNIMRVATSAPNTIFAVGVYDRREDAPGPPAKIFIQAPRPQVPRLEYFIAYSVNSAQDTQPWNQLKFDWESGDKEVYAW